MAARRGGGIIGLVLKSSISAERAVKISLPKDFTSLSGELKKSNEGFFRAARTAKDPSFCGMPYGRCISLFPGRPASLEVQDCAIT